MIPKRPNVLFVMADQHLASCLGVEGHPQVKTPHLDRLAREGTRFTSAYTQNPICTPSRISLLSGQYPHNHGFYGLAGPAPAALPNFLGHFRAHGYRTAAIGKLHLPDTPRNWIADDVDFFGECYRSVDGLPGQGLYYRELDALGLRAKEDSRILPELGHGTHDARPSEMPYEHCVEQWCAAHAERFMAAAAAEKHPFCLEVSLPRPHHQLTPDRRFWDLYPEDLDAPSTRDHDPSHRPPHFREMYEDFRSTEWLYEPRTFDAGTRRAWRGYLACISQVDDTVGRLLRFLDEHGLADNTIVAYGSDHGGYHGHLGIVEKAPGICSEAVCRVPFLWRVPGRTRPGTVCDQLVENVDLAPTLAVLAGLPPMEASDGKDLTPLLAGEDRPLRELAVTENPWSKAIRWNGWRYVHYQPEMFAGEDYGELYDLDKDPDERCNLYRSTEHRDVVAASQRLLLDWLIKTSRPVTVHPTIGDRVLGDHHYRSAGDGRESNLAGVPERIRRGLINYL